MPDEPATPDREELIRRQIEATNRGDFDAVMSIYAPNAVTISLRHHAEREAAKAEAALARIEGDYIAGKLRVEKWSAWKPG
jgi:ketosteroid isomerase-like protein